MERSKLFAKKNSASPTTFQTRSARKEVCATFNFNTVVRTRNSNDIVTFDAYR
jgi:hypothetical protein